MTDSLERFLQDLHFEVPAGLSHRAQEAAASHDSRQVSSRRDFNLQHQPWALALVAALIAVAIVATLVFGARALHPKALVPGNPVPSRATASATCPISGGPVTTTNNLVPTKMVSPTTGWAKGPLRTTDGGAHWHDVSPPSLPNRTSRSSSDVENNRFFDAEFFLDSTHAWTVQRIGPAASSSNQMVIFATTNGGQTWQHSAPVPLGISGLTGIHLTVCFIDSQHGWLLVELGCPVEIFPGHEVLYATSDGGLQWKVNWKLSFRSSQCQGIPVPPTDGESLPCLPTLMGVTFVSPTTGWGATCRPDAPALWVTHDGGVTWKVQRLPASSTGGSGLNGGASGPNGGCPCVAPLPVFFNDQQGILLGDVLLTTSDGGSTWVERPLPSTRSASGVLLPVAEIDFLDYKTAWAFVPPPGWVGRSPNSYGLYRTGDGGLTWTLVQSDLSFGGTPEFVDANNGFEWPTGNASHRSDGQVPEMLTTTDGGHTWKAVASQIVGP